MSEMGLVVLITLPLAWRLSEVVKGSQRRRGHIVKSAEASRTSRRRSELGTGMSSHAIQFTRMNVEKSNPAKVPDLQ